MRHRVLRLRRQHRRDQDLKRILLLILGDLLHRWFLEPVDRARETAHHGANAPAGNNGLRRQPHTGVSGGFPDSTAITFLTARSAMAVRVSRVALPRCGDEDDVLERQQSWMDGRLLLEHVERSAGNAGALSVPTRALPLRRSSPAPCSRAGGSLHPREGSTVEQMPGLRRRRRVNRDDVRADEQFVERHVVFREDRRHAECRPPLPPPRDRSARVR